MVIVEGTIFGLSHRASGQFFALDVTTGEVLWLGADAELIVVRAIRSGFEPLKRYTVAKGATWAQPAISGNRIFVKDVSSLTLWTLDE
jgi:outer membrane protein assembly factor BamB